MIKKLMMRAALLLGILALAAVLPACTEAPNEPGQENPVPPAEPEEPEEPEKPEEPEISVPADGSFAERLEGAKINGTDAVNKVSKIGNGLPGLFKGGRFEVEFIQPVDHSDKASKTFTQRVLISLVSEDAPVVFVTQGYDLDSWGFYNNSYTTELVNLLRCNQVIVEHRYFGGSVPAGAGWEAHTVENEVNDLHRINQVLREIFKGQKFISTGRSKGGQTALYYETFYPEDTDICVPYVAPFLWKMNDRRNVEFLKQVGSAAERERVHEFQQELFDRRSSIVPLFKARLNPDDFSADLEQIYDLTVLEYSFSYWQNGPSGQLPSDPAGASDSQLLNSLLAVSSPGYFSYKDMPNFIVNAMRDYGYYGYDLSQFTGTKITQAECDRWVEDIAAPLDARQYAFDPALSEKTKKFLQNNTTEKMIFIYGANDTWTSAAVGQEYFTGKTNMFRYDCPGGNHSTEIGWFSNKNEIIGKIRSWLAE